MSQTGQQITTVHVLCNILGNNHDQAMKFVS